MEIRKGTINTYQYTSKYDDDGIEYRQFSLTIDGKKYTSKTPKDIYLNEGAPIIFEASGSEIHAAFCPIQGTKWGKNAQKLKRSTGADERYEFVQGTVLEKRRSVNDSIDLTKTDRANSEPRVGYTVILKDETRFNASSQFGKPLKPGMEIAVVLEKNSAVLLLDQTRGRFHGRQKPYFILFSILLIVFTPGMYYVQKTKPDLLVNFDGTLTVINIFLGLALLLSIFTYLKGRTAMKVMRAGIKNQSI